MQDNSSVNILLVDDRPENLLVLEGIIVCEEYNLIKASSGEEALKYLLKFDFAVILLDVQMPVMDGFTAAKIIKERQRTRNTPIIFITANYMDSKHVLTGYSLGAMDYILKPFDPLVLKSKVSGFVEVFKLNRKLAYQAEMLARKTEQLEKTCAELSRTTSSLQVSEALANVISETTIDSMIIMDGSGCILKANPAVKAMFMYEQSEILGRNITELFSSEEAVSYLEKVLESVKNNNSISGSGYMEDVSAARKDGTHFPAELQIGLKTVQDKCIIACTIRDITKKKQDAEIIKHMAYHDSLTGLPNRRKFNDHLDFVMESARLNNQSFVLMHLDFDRFRYINDSLGHNKGDKVLQEIAARLKSCVPKGSFIARNDGDEFSIILSGTNREAAIEIAEEVQENIQKPFYIDAYEIYVTASIGVSVYPFDGKDPIELMKNADAALYRAKEKGKNQYKIFHTGLIIQIGEWVLRSACYQYKAWQEAGLPPVRIAVNFSVKQFLERDLINNIKQILGEAEVPPEMIEIEITESVILEN